MYLKKKMIIKFMIFFYLTLVEKKGLNLYKLHYIFIIKYL